MRYPEVTLSVTEDHFKRAVPGDMCHCTLGESVHDALPQIMSALDLETVDGNTISVNPADANGAPCVGVSFKAVRTGGEDVNVLFLLEEASAFKIAYTTDNKATGQMRRRAAVSPYVLRASALKVRRSRAGLVTDGGREASTVTPEGHIKALATYAVRMTGTQGEAMNRVAEKLETKKADGTLPYKLTPRLRKFAQEAVADSFAAKGSQAGRNAPLKVHRTKRFYS